MLTFQLRMGTIDMAGKNSSFPGHMIGESCSAVSVIDGARLVELVVGQLGREPHAFDSFTIEKEHLGFAVVQPRDGMLSLHMNRSSSLR
ncbi:hypothetical protein [Mesorhizobium sangaii]|uniref:Uncharacterized protein n=1 Tax=Mesorhizobium sangaii TaxID=505389 RepID=A0A841PTZ4_9HYPH|nr:hypothetical protein [Mesorhizobium sangaii]MBB6414020.1 hypothetical protein [Mesorhizobium sangaii]